MSGRKLKFSFFGGTGEVTGSNFLLEIPDGGRPKRLLIDCGLFQGKKIGDPRNREPFPYDPSSIDALIVTHAHIDHTGRIPKLVKDGFRGVIYSTPPTKELSREMLLDSMGVLEKESRQDNLPLLYTESDVAHAEALWKTAPYLEPFVVGEASVTLREAGHTLGSSMVEVRVGGTKVLFTGDLGNSPAPLLRDAQIVPDANYMIIESVYGDRVHEDRDRRKQVLEDVIEDTIKKGGTLMIPAFSLERTQEVLYEIETMMDEERIPLVPVFLDSPLAIKVTDIYRKYESYFNAGARNLLRGDREILSFAQLHKTLTTEESKSISEKFANIPKIIIAGSGMSNGGRIIHHEKRYLPDPKSTLLLIGYQAAGTLGRRLQDGEKQVKILGEEVNVNARIVTIHGYSGHRDSNGLLDFVSPAVDSLKKVFVVMGEPKSSLFLVQRIRDYLGVPAISPQSGETIEIQV